MKTLHCPSREDWQRFDRGLLDAMRLAALDKHLDECPSCAELLDQLEENQDTLLAGLRHDAPEYLANDQELQELLNRAAREPFNGESTVSALGKGFDTDDPDVGRGPVAAPRRLPEIDGYRITRILGQGGMGVVYEAVQLDLNRRVAIKTIRAGELAQDDQVARFRQEATAAAALDHPHIVPVFEVGESNGLHYFTMAYVDGVSLEQAARTKAIDVRTCAELVARLAGAIHYAHERGVVHRDLKPDNVMLDAAGAPHITDFGLARRIEADDRLTSTGQIMGTAGYMSPEQAQGRRDAGPASDIYSLGAILYRLLADRPPFRGDTPLDTLREVIEREPVSPRLLNSKTPRDLETICLKCLEKSPARRYESAAALAAELARFLAGEPILARSLGPVSRALRWCQRKPRTAAWMAAVASLVIVCAAALAGARNYAARLTLERERAQLQDRLANLDSFEHDAEIEDLLTSLARRDARQGEQARTRYQQALRGLWERRLQETSRLSADDVRALEQAIPLVTDQNAAHEEELRELLNKRLAQWQTEFHATPAGAGGPGELPGGLTAADGELRLAKRSVETAVGSRRWLSSVPSGANCELEAEFAEGWRRGSELGLLLSADGAGAYEFIVRHDPEAGWLAEIRREQTTLFRERVALPETGPLRLWARREESQLKLQVGDKPVMEFDDLLALRLGSDLQFGVLWPEGTSLLELRGRRPLAPARASPLEEADARLSRGEFASALRRYEEIRVTPGAAEQGELAFKKGLCQEKLNRISLAVGLFQEVIRGGDPTWSTRAACQQWHLHLVHHETKKAEAVLEQVRGLDISTAARVVPADVRERILAEYSGTSGGIANLLRSDPRSVDKAKVAVEVESKLNVNGAPSANALFRLYEAYDYAGQTRFAKLTMERLLAGDVRGLEGYYGRHYCRQFRLAGEHEQAALEIERRLAAAQGIEREWLLFERACLAIAREEWQLAYEQMVSLCDGEMIARPGGLPAQLGLALGFLEGRLGRPAEAQKSWREATARLRPSFQAGFKSGNELVDFLALAALAGDLRPEDIQLLTTLIEETPGPASLVVKAVPVSSIQNAWQVAFTTPRGRELAEQFAFDSIPRAQKVRQCFELVGANYCLLGAFAGSASPQDEQVVFDLVGELFENVVDSGELDTAASAAILAAWTDNFGTGLVLWNTVAYSKLSPPIRGRLAYVMSKRFRSRGNLTSADALLKQARENANANSDKTLQQLIQQATPAQTPP